MDVTSTSRFCTVGGTTTTLDVGTTTTISANCGNGTVEPETEDCDDGENAWSPGEKCNGVCRFLACGYPDDVGGTTASDALFTLRTGVGTSTCDACVCDTDESGSVTVTDSLRLLKAAVGQQITLTCPVCTG